MAESADRWWQRDTDGGAGGLGGMDGTNSGGHRVEEVDQGTVESKGASSGETEVEWGRGARQGHGGQRQGVCQRLNKARDMGEGEPWLLFAMFDHTSITLYC